MLFLGCGDLRNPFTTAVGCRLDRNLEIHINDSNVAVIARNILIHRIVSSPKFDPNSEKDLGYLWDVWYNTTWPESTLDRFLQDIKNLLTEPLADNVCIIEGPNKEESWKEVCKNWLTIIETCSVDSLLLER